MNGLPTRLEHDWYPGVVPANVYAAADVYFDSAYGFALFGSTLEPGLELGEASGVYDRAAFVVGPEGWVAVGPYTCLNGASVVCNERIEIGSHCFLGWGAVVTDTWPGPGVSLRERRAAFRRSTAGPHRRPPVAGPTRPVVIEENVWVGFDAVILPGVTLGTGCVVGCKAVIAESVPAYAVVAGDPPRIIRQLDPMVGDLSRPLPSRSRSLGAAKLPPDVLAWER
jgi:acetyltransferase-like isoleucine patch superfamily enzyme